jgi:hypothetical protein
VPFHRVMFLSLIVILAISVILILVEKLLSFTPFDLPLYIKLLPLILLTVFTFIGYPILKSLKQLEAAYADIIYLGEKKSIVWLDIIIMIFAIGMVISALIKFQIMSVLSSVAVTTLAGVLINLIARSPEPDRGWQKPDDPPEPRPQPSPPPKPRPQPAPDVGPQPEVKDSDFIQKEYKWHFPALAEFSDKTYSFSTFLYRPDYEKYKTMNIQRKEKKDYNYLQEAHLWVVESSTQDIWNVMEKIRKLNASDKYDYLAQINNFLAFIHQFAYKYDEETTQYEEYARFPIETLMEEVGDCECVSILLASLLYNGGYDVVLLNPPGHVAVGVSVPPLFPEPENGWFITFQGKKYFYCEATGQGWQMGTLPDDCRVDMKVYPVG